MPGHVPEVRIVGSPARALEARWQRFDQAFDLFSRSRVSAHSQGAMGMLVVEIFELVDLDSTLKLEVDLARC